MNLNPEDAGDSCPCELTCRCAELARLQEQSKADREARDVEFSRLNRIIANGDRSVIRLLDRQEKAEAELARMTEQCEEAHAHKDHVIAENLALKAEVKRKDEALQESLDHDCMARHCQGHKMDHVDPIIRRALAPAPETAAQTGNKQCDPMDSCECDHVREDHPVKGCDGCWGCDEFRLRGEPRPEGEEEKK